MDVIINLANATITVGEVTHRYDNIRDKEFFADSNNLIKGIYKGVDRIDFITPAQKIIDFVKTPIIKKALCKVLTAYIINAEVPIFWNGSKLTMGVIDYAEEDRERFLIEKDFQEDTTQAVKLILENDRLCEVWLNAEEGKRFTTLMDFMNGVVNNSGYIVDMVSNVPTTSKMIYDYFDGTEKIEGIRRKAKTYERYQRTFFDTLKCYLSVEYYVKHDFPIEKESEDEYQQHFIDNGIKSIQMLLN